MMDTATNNDQYRFIGRTEAINKFNGLLSLMPQKNSLYVEAEGGLGKTRLLQELIRQSQAERLRPWHVCPPDSQIDIIIDFHDFQNRNIAGLRRSIVARLGQDHFTSFLEKDEALHQLEVQLKETPDDQASKSKALALRVEVEQLFFQELSRALLQIKRYVTLFFDTFELVYNRRVGRWFLEEFLPHPAVESCTAVFAGRPQLFTLPDNVDRYKLPPFSQEEAEDYFRTRWGFEPDQPEWIAIAISQGSPLMLDLIAHYSRTLRGNIAELATRSRREWERSIVSRFLTPDDLIHDVIQDMAYLKRRYNRAIYERRQPKYTDQADYQESSQRLKQYPFVKYRPGDDVFALHDLFQEMMVEHGGPDFQAMSSDLYQDIVLDWYPQAANQAQAGVQSHVLRAEHLAYILENDREKGIQIYRDYLARIKQSLEFDFNDLLWGEVAEHLQPNEEGYTFFNEQADWLFNSARYTDAAYLYEMILENYRSFLDTDQLNEATFQLGHCYLNTGQIQSAENTWEKGRELAVTQNNFTGLAYFNYNLGHVRDWQGQWKQALELYEAAIEHAQQIGEKELVAQALFVMARLRAREGNYRQALGEIKRSLNLFQQFQLDKMLQIKAFIFAGDIYRYVGDAEAAKGYYQLAVDRLENLAALPEWRAQAYAGLGAAYYLSGLRARSEDWGNLSTAITEQQQACHYLKEALDLAREHHAESRLSTILDRLADLYLELDELEALALAKGSPDQSLTTLRKSLEGISLVEETNWRSAWHEAGKPFVALNTLGKAQRLFEIAFLQAEKQRTRHQAIDALVGAARVAQKRGRLANIQQYAEQVRILGHQDDPGQASIFLALIEVLKAHLLFSSDPDKAVGRYEQAFAELAQKGGFGWYLARRELPEVKNLLLNLSRDEANQYCQQLVSAWQPYEELVAFVHSIQDLLL